MAGPWPPDHVPEGAALFVRNELEMSAQPQDVWAWLVRCDRWSDYYGNARRVRVVDGPGPPLELGSKFKWITFNAPVTSVVQAFEPERHIGWDAKSIGARGYHWWQIEPTAGGCKVVTEETQRGWGARLMAPLLRGQMQRQHQRWLEGLERAARGGPSPSDD